MEIVTSWLWPCLGGECRSCSRSRPTSMQIKLVRPCLLTFGMRVNKRNCLTYPDPLPNVTLGKGLTNRANRTFCDGAPVGGWMTMGLWLMNLTNPTGNLTIFMILACWKPQNCRDDKDLKYGWTIATHWITRCQHRLSPPMT